MARRPRHRPGYITWDQFLANRTNPDVLAGPVREGLCLLQGLLLCGACGRRAEMRLGELALGSAKNVEKEKRIKITLDKENPI